MWLIRAKFVYMIQFQDAIRLMRSKDRFGNLIPFKVEWVSCNEKLKTGGKVMVIEQAIYTFPRSASKQKTKTNNWLNGTIDVKPLGGSKFTRIHLQLIRRINDKVVA
jgi:hypothetical protein